MGITARLANAFKLRRQEVVKPRVGQVVTPLALDRWREYPADGLTPSRLISILRAADEGSIEQAMALYEQMEEKDAHLYSVAQTRRLAVTGLEWQVVSAADVRDGVERAAADEAAAYCREALAELESLDEVLQHLSLAMGRNIAVAENIWEADGRGLRLADVVPVGFDRLTFGEMGEPRVLTADEPIRGIELPAFKFIVHTPQTASGHAMRGGLLRVSAIAYLGKHLSIKDWMVYAEIFGMPVRVARYDPSATPEEKRELLTMLQSLGSDAAGVFSKAVELQLLEAGRGATPPPYENICNFFNRELSKAWLGQTLTVEVLSGSGGGVHATGPRVHNEVRLDLRQDDVLREGRTLRRDLLRSLVALRFPPGTPVPYFRRQLDVPRNLREYVDVLNVAVNDLSMRIPAQWAHRVLGVPSAAAGEVLPGRPR
jgi:phage gp29-like protein